MTSEEMVDLLDRAQLKLRERQLGVQEIHTDIHFHLMEAQRSLRAGDLEAMLLAVARAQSREYSIVGSADVFDELYWTLVDAVAACGLKGK